MTQEEAIEILQEEHDWMQEPCYVINAIKKAIEALRPVSREQVEKVFPGCEKCRNQANWPSWIEKGFVYCPKCGTPLCVFEYLHKAGARSRVEGRETRLDLPKVPAEKGGAERWQGPKS